MKSIKFFLLLLGLLISSAAEGEFKANFTLYHTSDQIDKELKSIAENCNGFMTHEIILKEPEIAMLTYTNPKISNANKTHAFFIFGEHARELIAVEAGLYMAKVLCGKAKNSLNSEYLSHVRDNYILKFVVNSNPGGRRLVEKGQYCLRMNHKGVDINRNWGNHWRTEQPDDKEFQTVPGSKPFSEPETECLKKAIEKHKPKIFLDIHSGMKALLAPYAFKDSPVDNIKEISNLFKRVNDKYCKCEAGSAVKLLHYESYGCAMDYVYDNIKAKYSFAWEIYGIPEEELSTYNIHRLKKLKFMSKSMIRRMKQRSELAVIEDPKECFSFFNPFEKTEYDDIVKTWSEAVLDLLKMIEEQESSSKTPTKEEKEEEKDEENQEKKSKKGQDDNNEPEKVVKKVKKSDEKTKGKNNTKKDVKKEIKKVKKIDKGEGKTKGNDIKGDQDQETH